MKKLSPFVLGAFGACLLLLNYNIQNSPTSAKARSSNLKLIRIQQALAQSGGTEYYCDHSTTTTCTIKVGNSTGYDTGQPHFSW